MIEQTVKFVTLSALFDGCPSMNEEMNEADVDVTFGDADMTLVSVERFSATVLRHLDDALHNEYQVVEKRLADLKANDIYIDLEN